MRKIKTVRKTRYFATKHTIQDAVEFFKENKDEYFVEAELIWEDISGQQFSEKATIRREIISQYYQAEVTGYEESGGKVLAPQNKQEFMELWEMIVKNQPSNLKDGRKQKRKGFKSLFGTRKNK